ncbi:hypothetical protein V8E36_003978 [Tilletia maclaganii]
MRLTAIPAVQIETAGQANHAPRHEGTSVETHFLQASQPHLNIEKCKSYPLSRPARNAAGHLPSQYGARPRMPRAAAAAAPPPPPSSASASTPSIVSSINNLIDNLDNIVVHLIKDSIPSTPSSLASPTSSLVYVDLYQNHRPRPSSRSRLTLNYDQGTQGPQQSTLDFHRKHLAKG